MILALLPLYFLRFWFIEAPKEIIAYFISLNGAFLHLFSVPLLLRTFFQPIKNEYRKGLIGFSIGMGIVIKSFLILASLPLLAALIVLELLVLIGFLVFPLATIAVLFV